MTSTEYGDWQAYYALERDYAVALTDLKMDPEVATRMIWGPPKE